MPIDDALEGIPGAAPPGRKPAEISAQIETTIADMLSSYPSAVAEVGRLHGWPAFIPEYPARFHEWMKFDTGLAAKIKEVPQDNVIAIVGAIDEKLKYLLQETDLKNCLGDSFFVARPDAYVSVPPFLNLQQILGFSDIQTFLQQTQQFFAIPNLTFASLFIEEGEKLRHYAASAKKDTAFSLRVFGDMPIEYRMADPFTVESLTEFSTKTGITEVKAMVEQLLALADKIDNYRRLNDESSLRGMLYGKLQRYHPELTTGGSHGQAKT